MEDRRSLLVWLAISAAASPLLSIVGAEVFMGAALLAAILLRRGPGKLPLFPPLALWVVWTVVPALVFGFTKSGFPQIRKLIWFGTLIAVVAGLRAAGRNIKSYSALLYTCTGAATISAAWSLIQFVRKYSAARAAHQDFYTAYVADRITGLMGIWMTFSGQMMIVLVLIVAYVLFAKDRRALPWLLAASALIGAGLLLAETRSMWGGAALGAAYLLWIRKRWLVALIPVAVGAILLANPFGVRERALSIVQPHGETDSNAHRRVTRAIGIEMIKAHPLFGVGLEQVGPRHLEYVPASVSLPLPVGYYGHLHNIYIHYAAERGIPAALAILWMFGRMLYDFWLAARSDSPLRWLFHGAVAVTLAVMFGGYFEVNLGDSEVLALFLGVVGAAYAARYTLREGGVS